MKFVIVIPCLKYSVRKYVSFFAFRSIVVIDQPAICSLKGVWVRQLLQQPSPSLPSVFFRLEDGLLVSCLIWFLCTLLVCPIFTHCGPWKLKPQVVLSCNWGLVPSFTSQGHTRTEVGKLVSCHFGFCRGLWESFTLPICVFEHSPWPSVY